MLTRESYQGFSAIGKRVPRVDGYEKISGRAAYLPDIDLPGMLYGKILRSRYPHAKILSIDTSAAERLPGVVAVITAKDASARNIGFMKDQPPLKHGKVRSVRDEVAAVAAVDEERAEEALELIKVEYEELPPVLDPFEAMKPDAPLVHEELGTNIVGLDFRFNHGSVEGALKNAYKVVEGTYRTQYVNASPLETMGCIASYGHDGHLTIYSNTQAPFQYAKELADALGIDGSRITVIQPSIGGAFGRGMDLYPIDVIAALLSIKTKRPVKITHSRYEELSYAPPRQPVIIRMRHAANREGKLLAREASCIVDNGPYVSWGAFDCRVMMATVTGLYEVPNVRFEATVVYTNNPYCGTQRGAGNPQITFAIESQMDMLAEELNMDPVEFRLLNANRPNTVTPQGMVITSCGLRECIESVAREIGWRGRRSAGQRRGIGFASYFHVGGGARVYRSDGCGSTVKVDDFGKVTLITGATEIGTGSLTAMAQVVAEELGIPVERVEVVSHDTRVRPWDVGTHASRTTFVGGNSALMAARLAKRKLLDMASRVLEVPASELDVKDGFVFHIREPSKKMAVEKMLRAAHFKPAGDVIVASAFYDPPNEMQDKGHRGNISATYAFGAQAVLVEVDEETGMVRVLKVVSSHDAGRIINPSGAEGQVHGGVVMGMGLALTEELILDEGRVLNSTLMDYHMPSSLEAPEVEALFVQTEDPAGPFGAKGIGETGCIPMAAAISNAVYDAVGVRLCELPLRPERVWAAILEAKSRKAP